MEPSSASFMIPTWTKPFIVLVVTAIILPGSSFLGHLLGLGAGFLMAMGRLKFMIEPPSKIVLWIESKLSFAIALLPAQIKYIKEIDAIEIRKNNAAAGGIASTSSSVGNNSTSAGLPLHEVNKPKTAPINPFFGQGNVLGNVPGPSSSETSGSK